MKMWKSTFGKSLPSVRVAVIVVSAVLALLTGGTVQVFAADSTGEAGGITTASLLDDLTNLANMPEFPSPAYTCRQFSPYDRASTSPSKPGCFATRDYGQYLREENRDGRKDYVLMDAERPGAIVRIWSASPFAQGKYRRSCCHTVRSADHGNWELS